MNLDAWLAMRARKAGSAPKHHLSALYAPEPRAAKPLWWTRSATSAKELTEHRAAIEHDCFKGLSHQRILRAAAQEYDRQMAESKNPGRPKLPPIDTRRVA